MEQVECAALEVLAGDIFQRLPAGPQVHAVSYLRVAGHGPDHRVLEMRNQFGNGVGGNHRVGVDTDVDFLAQPVERVVQCGGLAGVGLGKHLDMPCLDLRRIGLASYLCGPIRRPVVNHNHMQVLVVGVKHRADSTDDHRLFVIGGNEHRDARVVARGGQVVRLP